MNHGGGLPVTARLLNVGIRVKIVGIVLGTVLVVGLWVTAQTRRALRATLSRELEMKGLSLARDVAAQSTDLLLTDNVFALHRLLLATCANDHEIPYVLVLNGQGAPVDHTLDQPPSLELLRANRPQRPALAHVSRLRTTAGWIRDVAAPILEGRAGTVRVGMSERRLNAQIAVTTRRALVATILAGLAGVALAALVTTVLVEPIRELIEVTRAVGRGDFTQTAPVRAQDEIGKLAADFNAMTASLLSSRQALEREKRARKHLLQKVITAQEDERKRVSRELHDQTSQTLTSLMVGLKVLESSCPADAAWEQVGNLRAELADALEEVHRLARELRPSALDDLGLPEALRRFIREFGDRFGIAVDFDCPEPAELPLSPEVETAVYRLVQEALTNVAKHARARTVSVLLKRRDASLLTIVEDDGRGFVVDEETTSPESDRCLGLFGMRERAALIGGRFHLESAPGEGTTVFVEAPLTEVPSGG